MEKKHSLAGVIALAVLITFGLAPFANAQSGFEQTNLVSDIPGVAQRLDPNLVNPWGIVASPSDTIWIADNGTGVSHIYSQSGDKARPGNPLVVPMPASKTRPESGNPTGIVL